MNDVIREEEIAKLVRNIIDDYEGDKSIDRINIYEKPDKARVHELVDNLFAADFLSHERNDVISHLIELHNAVKLLGTLSYCYTHVDLPYRLENKLIF